MLRVYVFVGEKKYTQVWVVWSCARQAHLLLFSTTLPPSKQEMRMYGVKSFLDGEMLQPSKTLDMTQPSLGRNRPK